MSRRELARAAGVNPETVRFYERQGLLLPPPRSSRGYREYAPDTLGELASIAKLRKVGFALDDIGRVMRLSRADAAFRAELRRRLDALEQMLADLRVLTDD